LRYAFEVENVTPSSFRMSAATGGTTVVGTSVAGGVGDSAAFVRDLKLNFCFGTYLVLAASTAFVSSLSCYCQLCSNMVLPLDDVFVRRRGGRKRCEYRATLVFGPVVESYLVWGEHLD